jgi:Xaa-Pro aminopeptidase
VTPAPSPFGAPGHIGVDYEQRVDFDRYVTTDHQGEVSAERQRMRSVPTLRLLQHPLHHPDAIRRALGDKTIRYCLLTRDREPISWDVGSAVRHHKLYSPWLRRTGGLASSGSAARSPRMPA